MKTGRISANKFKRMWNWSWRQKSKTPICPISPSLTGKIIVITGGTKGIGLETVNGLLERDAEVIMLSRDKDKAKEMISQNKKIDTLEDVLYRNKNKLYNIKGKLHFVKLDLGDVNSIVKTVDTLEDILWGRKIDILINNAGIALQEPWRESSQGFELTFAVNVLGHHVLFKECHSKDLFKKSAHFIAVTGDIYIMADDCTPDYKYEGDSGMIAYARSKLGVMWWAYECHHLYPEYKVNIVHPGVVPMGLGADSNSLSKRLLEYLLLTPKEGAQTTLLCATQPDIENGAYYHNTLGKAILPDTDIALNIKKSKSFWTTLENIYKNVK